MATRSIAATFVLITVGLAPVSGEEGGTSKIAFSNRGGSADISSSTVTVRA